MEKRQIYLFFLMSIILILPLVLADDIDVADSTTENSVIDRAEDCINSWLDNYGCEDLSTEELIFTYLGIQKCKSELISASDDEECWPDGNCKLTTTSKAILALDSTGSSVKEAKEWLIDQSDAPSDLDWYLQIESSEETNCEIQYDDKTYDIIIYDDKTIGSNAGNCLVRSSGNWWLRISSSCFDQEFRISCDQPFLTNLLFKKTGSSIVQVMKDTHSASAEGATYEKVDSMCLETDGKCDYEGTLWGAIALKSMGENYTEYLPYLMADAGDHTSLIPNMFLYFLTGYESYRNDLLLSQINDQYWDESGDKFYDTALALFAFRNEEPSEKKNAKDWLGEVQGEDGCWRGNILDTAFILHSAFSTYYPSSFEDEGSVSCWSSGYYCMSESDCEGNILDSLFCSGDQICCDTEKTFDPCETQGGLICDSLTYSCKGSTVQASDLESGQICCVDGECILRDQETTKSACEYAGGTCGYICGDGTEETYEYECSNSNQICCIPEKSSSLWWLWVLLIILIALIVFTIIFREKLKPYYYKIKGKIKSKIDQLRNRKKGKKNVPPTRTNAYYPYNAPPRKIIPRRKLTNKTSPQKQNGEIDEVLKKLKEIGK